MSSSCLATAGWAGLTVSVDPRFPNQQTLERFLAREERQAYANLDAKTLAVKRLSGGVIQVFAERLRAGTFAAGDTVCLDAEEDEIVLRHEEEDEPARELALSEN